MAKRGSSMYAASKEMPKLGGQSGTIGGSNVGSILGLNKWSSPWDVWARHVLGVYDECDPEDEQDPRNRGTRLEPIVRALASEELGLTILEPQGSSRTIYHPDDKRFTASIDGVVRNNGEAVGLAEFKTANLNAWKGGQVPEYQWWQLQHYLWLTGHSKGWFFCLRADENTFYKIRTVEDAKLAIHFNGARLWTVEVAADPAYKKEIVPQLEHFFDSYLATGTPPPVDYSKGCKEALRILYPQTDEIISITPELASAARDYIWCRQSMKQIEKDKAKAANRIREALAGKAGGIPHENHKQWLDAKTAESRADCVKASADYVGFNAGGAIMVRGFECESEI
jgi:predicted phage-related endonuclease